MSQHDFTINNQTASSARSDINNALKALASNNSGDAAPTTTFANMLWYETDTNRLYMRNEANTAWLNFGYIDQTGGLEILDNTPVVTTAGTQTGVLGDQTTATWQTGTGTTQSLVSPANVKASVLAHAPATSTSLNGIGTYAHVMRYSSVVHNAGDTVAGNLLGTWELYSSTNQSAGGDFPIAAASKTVTLRGTWRWMSSGLLTGTRTRFGVAVRVS